MFFKVATPAQYHLVKKLGVKYPDHAKSYQGCLNSSFDDSFLRCFLNKRCLPCTAGPSLPQEPGLSASGYSMHSPWPLPLLICLFLPSGPQGWAALTGHWDPRRPHRSPGLPFASSWEVTTLPLAERLSKCSLGSPRGPQDAIRVDKFKMTSIITLKH